MRALLLAAALLAACTPAQLALVNERQADRGLRPLISQEADAYWCANTPADRVAWFGWATIIALRNAGSAPQCGYQVTWPWDALAQCESGGNWSLSTGNGYYGGLQFSLTTWRGVGGTGYPHQHSAQEQIARGRRLQALQGWGAWPSCSRQIGLR